MRRKDREITDQNKIDEVITSSHCCRLGFSDNGSAYIVPLSFGFTHTENKRTFYFHGSAEGRKADLIRKNGRASFEIDTAYKLKEAGKACGYSAAFQSVMGEGKIGFINDPEEKKRALSLILKHYTGKDEWSFDERLLTETAVFSLEVSDISCKIHE